jgi:hypothetical protein
MAKEKLSPTDIQCRNEVCLMIDAIDDDYANRCNAKTMKILKRKLWNAIGTIDFHSAARIRQSTSPIRGENRKRAS